MEGVDVVHDLRKGPWPWADASVSEAHCSHFLEHLTNLDGKWERIIFFNELYRIVQPGGSCQLIIPHWASNRYYGDPTHKEPFSEMGFYYLDRNWRTAMLPMRISNTIPTGMTVTGSAPGDIPCHPSLSTRNTEYQQFAIANYKEACMDIVCTMVRG